ncbi:MULTISPECIES: ABC transporter substrate-binding protein [Pantoea]|uniref:Nitrate ABC transporter substrate-binding protein n=2 Tax=Pantoea TaxID=53335 RepID=A0A0U3UUL4_9GAMM|nr:MULTISPECIES: ABC transporter substrate-binding protein [Pantoea]ALV94032.1 nitrate ABC transporter substrate-binding protein [Pantoea vagans]KHJ69475.1 nitrate ABC transporter substrate-binding protein [Pantoea rodasii]
MQQLIFNQGDASESRIYYCAHYLADSLGLFAAEQLQVTFTTSATGGHTVQGGQVPAVLSRDADLTLGGPMVVMKHFQQHGAELQCFCASVAANPWFLAAAQAQPDFQLSDLRGKRVLDVGNVGTATLTFRWLLAQHGLQDQVELISGSGDQARDFAAVAAGEADYALHAIHMLAPAIAAGQLSSVSSLATLCGHVPWSAYIARADVLLEKASAFHAFSRAIEQALTWIATHDATALADRVQHYYPDYPRDALVTGLAAYQHAQVFAPGCVIPQHEFEHFSQLLSAIGWLDPSQPVPYFALVTQAGAE